MHTEGSEYQVDRWQIPAVSHKAHHGGQPKLGKVGGGADKGLCELQVYSACMRVCLSPYVVL